MTKAERIKNMVSMIKEHIENCAYGYDMQDFSYVIKYKDGTIKHIYGFDFDKKISLNVRNIDYIVANDPADSWDTDGKSWYDDFRNDDYDITPWNEYVNKRLYA